MHQMANGVRTQNPPLGFGIVITGNFTPLALLSIFQHEKEKKTDFTASSPRWSVESWIKNLYQKQIPQKLISFPDSAFWYLKAATSHSERPGPSDFQFFKFDVLLLVSAS